MTHRLLTLAAILCAASISNVHAIPVLWTLQDVEFEDGAVASGSFVYDADADIYSGIAIVTDAGTLAPGGTFNTLLSGDAFAAEFVVGAPDLTDTPLLQLLFQAPLTNAGGAVALFDSFDFFNSSNEGTCDSPNCDAASFDRLMVDGGIFGVVVPLPAALYLFLTALVSVALVRKGGQ